MFTLGYEPSVTQFSNLQRNADHLIANNKPDAYVFESTRRVIKAYTFAIKDILIKNYAALEYLLC